ncbi:MAG: dihydropteroate synthase [Thermoplasmatales archaeon]|nr:dihydropteroate synthase [Thermoplasmatales archaeon]
MIPHPTPWRRGTVTYERPKIMGILNVTPDSFSDGGRHNAPKEALEHAFRMVDEGADMIDIGGESTRPGYVPVSAEEEIARLVPVIRDLAPSIDIPITVDTMKAEVARAAIDAGAAIVNDIYGLRGPGMLEYVAESGVPAIIMHLRGRPGDTHDEDMEGDAVAIVKTFLSERIEAALDAGVRESQIITDPGVGFGKTHAQNLEIVDRSGEFRLGHPVLIGVSRKRFLAHAMPGMDREAASVEMAVRAIGAGADIIRTHDVGALKEAIFR